MAMGFCLSASAGIDGQSQEAEFWEKNQANRGSHPLQCYIEYQNCLDEHPFEPIAYCRMLLDLCLPKQR